MEQPFYIGQKVVVIYRIELDLTTHKVHVASKGDTAAVLGMAECCTWVVNIGFPVPQAILKGLRCTECGKVYRDGIVWLDHRFFAPLQEGFEAITFERVMEEEKVSVN